MLLGHIKPVTGKRLPVELDRQAQLRSMRLRTANFLPLRDHLIDSDSDDVSNISKREGDSENSPGLLVNQSSMCRLNLNANLSAKQDRLLAAESALFDSGFIDNHQQRDDSD